MIILPTLPAAAGMPCAARLLGCLLLAVAGGAGAEGIAADLEIGAQADLLLAAAAGHPPPSLPAQGNATQTATVSAVLGGRRSAASVTAQLQPDGTLPQGGVLRQAGDGVGIVMNLSGLCDGAPAQTEGMYGEYSIDLRNRSAREAYRVTLRIDYANRVRAEGPVSAGEGAYAASLVSLMQDETERFSSALTSDTALGDRVDVTPTGAYGQPLEAAGARTLELDLKPGAALHLLGRQELRGAATTAGAGYHGSLDAFVSLIGAVRIPDRAGPAPGAATQVVEKNGGIANLRLAAACILLLLVVVWIQLRRRK